MSKYTYIVMYRLFSVLCWLWNIYEGAELIFHNKHKTLYNLFSPDPAVSCVGFTSWNVHSMKHFVAFRLGVSHFFLALDAFTWDNWILLAAFLWDFFPKLSGKHFIDHALQMDRLISPYCLCILPWFSNSGDTQISMYIHVSFGHAVFIKSILGQAV